MYLTNLFSVRTTRASVNAALPMSVHTQEPLSRKRSPLFISTLVAVIAVILVLQPALAAEYRVAPQGAEFSKIQDAISRASNGDTIMVASGLYNETVHISKTLVIQGVDTGGGIPVIASIAQGNIVEITAPGCTFSGFQVQNARMLSGIHVTSDRNLITGNTIIDCSQGILFETANNNTLADNNITTSVRSGIALEDSDRNLIENNTIRKNSIGMTLDEYSASNRVILNNFDNAVNIISKSITSRYDSEIPIPYTYLGILHNSTMGNYWSDYHGVDANGDGIGDTPYVIKIGVNQNAVLPVNQDSKDTFPLMDPVRYYHRGPAGSLLNVSPVLTVTPVLTKPVTVSANNTTGIVNPVLLPVEDLLSSTLLLLAFLGVCILIAGALILHYRRRSPDTGVQAPAPAEPSPAPAAPVQDSQDVQAPTPEPAAPVVTDAAATTVPGAGTTEGEPGPSPVSTQPAYFPRELEAKYTEIRLVGRGGIAWVYSAKRSSDGMMVAVKIPISFDEMTGKSFLNEIKVWEMLRHPNIVEISAVNILPVPYVEMEYVPGSLEAVKKPLPVWKAVYIVQGIADALRYAHDRGIIHRDIKPHNILVTADLTPKITDWGMSKVLATDPRKSSIAGFSLSYAAPEQVSPADYNRTTDVRTDIYQLGVVFYELVTGSIPFGGESIVSVGNAILKETALKPSEYNPDAAVVDRIIMKCLEKDPGLRYQTADEFLRALGGYLDEDET